MVGIAGAPLAVPVAQCKYWWATRLQPQRPAVSAVLSKIMGLSIPKPCQLGQCIVLCAACLITNYQPRPKRARADGTQSFVLFFFRRPSRARSAHPWPALIGRTACRGSAFLQRTAPALVCSSPIGRKMTRTLIWRQARTKRFVSVRRARTMPRAECCCWRC